MFFFPLSLLDSAIQYGQRRRLLTILRAYFDSPFAQQTSLCCQKLRIGQCSTREFSALYQSEEYEILATDVKNLHIEEWNPSFSSSTHIFLSNAVRRIYFIAEAELLSSELEPGPSSASASVVTEENIDFYANRIGVRDQNSTEFLFETDVERFFYIVLYCGEGNLSQRNGSQRIVSVQTVQFPIRASLTLCSSVGSALNMNRSHSRISSLLELLYEREHFCSHSAVNMKEQGMFASDFSLNLPSSSHSQHNSDDKFPLTDNISKLRFRSCSPTLVPTIYAKPLPVYITNRRDRQTDNTSIVSSPIGTTSSVQDSNENLLISDKRVERTEEINRGQSNDMDRESLFSTSAKKEENTQSNDLLSSDLNLHHPHSLNHFPHRSRPRIREKNRDEINVSSASAVRQNSLHATKNLLRKRCSSLITTPWLNFRQLSGFGVPALKYTHSSVRNSVYSHFQISSNSYQSNRCLTQNTGMSNDSTHSNGSHAKPPTILVYTGDNATLYKKIADSLITIIPRDIYTIFHLSNSALCNQPWVDNNTACLLIADTDLLNDTAWGKLQSYFVHAGKILFICQNKLCTSFTNCESVKKQIEMLKSAFGKKTHNALGKDFEEFVKNALKILNKCGQVNETFHARDSQGGYKYSLVFHKTEDRPFLLYMENCEQQASALFSDATTERLLSSSGRQLIADAMSRLGIEVSTDIELPELTSGYLICQTDKVLMDMSGISYDEEIGGSPLLIFRPASRVESEAIVPSCSRVPVEVCRRKDGIPGDSFPTEKYFLRLKTKSLGRALLFLPVCSSTIDICRSLNNVLLNFDGTVVTAGLQTAGVGRGGNQWLSPCGSLAFSFDFNIPLSSSLGSNITFLQHILAVSIVDAIRSLVRIEDFPLRIKWPNDIYYDRSFKMGGILISGSTRGQYLRCIVSAGLNVSNPKPTISINDLLPPNWEHTLTVAETLAEIMNKFEYYVNLFVNNGREEFLKVYYHMWLHSREEVRIDEEGGGKDWVIIRGLDEGGYLKVRSKQTGKIFSVYDDGNTFDMMKGLIRPKTF